MILREPKQGLAASGETGRDWSRSVTPGAGETLVLGLGNPILTDDGIGLLVVQKVHNILPSHLQVDIRQGSVAGFDLLDIISGFQRVIVIDAIKTARGRPGQIYRLTPEDLPTSERLASAHEISLSTALSLGRLMGFGMPGEVVIYAIEVEDHRTFSETCSPAVEAVVDVAAALVVLEVGGRPALRRGLADEIPWEE